MVEEHGETVVSAVCVSEFGFPLALVTDLLEAKFIQGKLKKR